MKRVLLLLIGLAFVLALSLSLVSCDSASTKETLTRAANVALTAGVISGHVTPAQASEVRRYGALILAADDGSAKLAAIGNAAVEAATVSGKITPEQAEALRAAGAVPLAPPPVALPVVEVTQSK
jgi:hypothetical protein